MTGRIKDSSLAHHFDRGRIEWSRVTMPVAASYGDEIRSLDLSGATITCFQHVLSDTPITLLPFVEAGARVRIAACNRDSTDDVAAAYLVASGAEVWAWSGMSEDEYGQGLDWAASLETDAISDMGGELIEAVSRGATEPPAALEATTSGLHRLATIDLTFPVFNWNDADLKNRIHNRHHVGMEVWPVFSAVTGLAIHGRSVTVLGFGPVGRGVALRARSLGADVSVVEPDPVKAFEALQHGCRVPPREEALSTAEIVATATGHEGVLGVDELEALRPGAIIFNVGHSSREIDVAWLDRHPSRRLRSHVTAFDLATGTVYLLNRGSLLNLAPGVMAKTEELFDPFAAMMLGGIAWILAGEASGFEPGIHPYPSHLEDEIARRALALRSIA